jgi:hypothetical protein
VYDLIALAIETAHVGCEKQMSLNSSDRFCLESLGIFVLRGKGDFFFFFKAVLRVEVRASHLIGRLSITCPFLLWLFWS